MKDGEIAKIPRSGFWWDRCCDCKLVHLNHIVKIGKDIFYCVYRDQYATEQARHKRKYARKPNKET